MTLSRCINPLPILCCTLLFFTGTFLSAKAQTKEVAHDNQQWLQYYNSLLLSDKWSISSDAGIRFKNHFDHFSTYIVRTAINYHLDNSTEIGLGFAHLGSYIDQERQLVEFRPFQEFNTTQTTHSIGLSHRFRVEERFFKSTDQAPVETEAFNFRFRYRFMVKIPLLSFSSDKTAKNLSFNAGDEIFINAGKEISHNIFDQNRILLGPVLEFNENISASFTYQHQFSSGSSPSQYRQTDVFWLSIKHKLSLVN
ncbi:DUF2490 domain-containing protein [Echinicola sediminis]